MHDRMPKTWKGPGHYLPLSHLCIFFACMWCVHHIVFGSIQSMIVNALKCLYMFLTRGMSVLTNCTEIQAKMYHLVIYRIGCLIGNDGMNIYLALWINISTVLGQVVYLGLIQVVNGRLISLSWLNDWPSADKGNVLLMFPWKAAIDLT